ncbi:hypothetical protein [Bradyrhizobium sp.]|uniref:hypothetical protein n=1 Tax=Bradyrhizobium sp. TaxID=376 RepID=UPI003C78EFA8
MSQKPKKTDTDNEAAKAKVEKLAQMELDAYSIEVFCRRHSISHGTYYNLKEKGIGPREGHVLGRVLITKEAALEWRMKITDG